MPVEWTDRRATPDSFGVSTYAAGDRPLVELNLWPNRSLPPHGFVLVIAGTFAAVLLPLLSVLGSLVLWGLLPFVMVPIALLWVALRRSYRDGEILETMTIWPDHLALHREERGSAPRDWVANPYWVRVTKHSSGGPVESYITLSGGDRDVELGAFLSQDERDDLYDELQSVLAEMMALAKAPIPSADAPKLQT